MSRLASFQPYTGQLATAGAGFASWKIAFLEAADLLRLRRYYLERGYEDAHLEEYISPAKLHHIASQADVAEPEIPRGLPLPIYEEAMAQRERAVSNREMSLVRVECAAIAPRLVRYAKQYLISAMTPDLQEALCDIETPFDLWQALVARCSPVNCSAIPLAVLNHAASVNFVAGDEPAALLLLEDRVEQYFNTVAPKLGGDFAALEAYREVVANRLKVAFLARAMPDAFVDGPRETMPTFNDVKKQILLQARSGKRSGRREAGATRGLDALQRPVEAAEKASLSQDASPRLLRKRRRTSTSAGASSDSPAKPKLTAPQIVVIDDTSEDDDDEDDDDDNDGDDDDDVDEDTTEDSSADDRPKKRRMSEHRDASTPVNGSRWTPEELTNLLRLAEKHKNKWSAVLSEGHRRKLLAPTRTIKGITSKYYFASKGQVTRVEADNQETRAEAKFLRDAIQIYGTDSHALWEAGRKKGLFLRKSVAEVEFTLFRWSHKSVAQSMGLDGQLRSKA
ncbi:hypothetical protein ACHHYP_08944 [Achlya hypogyna]|uniref:Myb-like domain-containing protein n=1 Tax=Achlya hypogyna TaxID=1202772 RepID=A0A1V9ZJT8_ACHHY|nr:hypothetical protein ACHHYP_08944 [Achlya hypogyna]